MCVSGCGCHEGHEGSAVLGLWSGDGDGEVVILRCSERLLCSVTLNVKGFPLGKGEETWWIMGLMEKRGGRLMVRCVVVSVGFRGEERSLCSKSGLASLTGDRLDRNDVVCCADKAAFFFAAFFKSL